MCGIVYVKRLDGKAAAKAVIKRYERQKDRGQDGFGYIALADKNTQGKLCRTTDEKNILKTLEGENAKEIIFHHRLPTSTANMKDLNHPIRISLPETKYLYWLVHNGIIKNDDELKKKHDELGIAYNTLCEKTIKTANEVIKNVQFNDSESFGIELALLLEGRNKKIEARGNTAFILLQTDKQGKPVKLYYGRNNGNPLKFYQQKELITICSEGQGEMIEKEMLYCYDYKTEKTTMRAMKFGEAIETTSVYGYGYGYNYGHHNYSWDAYDDSEDDFTLANGLEDDDVENYWELIEKKILIERQIEKSYTGRHWEKDMQRIEKLEEHLSLIEEKIKSYEKKQYPVAV